ncbi:MAG: HlyD family efflux transporter periplasmic adaptor subunit [Bryobacteraceae bacterium]
MPNDRARIRSILRIALLRKWIPVTILLLIGLGWGAVHLFRSRDPSFAGRTVGPVRQGEFVVKVRCRGEVRARTSRQLAAPINVSNLRLVWMAPPGSSVTSGQPVVRFDPSRIMQDLREKEAALKEAEATLSQAAANAKIAAEQDKLDLTKARHEVERARLEASKQEIVSAVKGEESRIDLRLAEEKLQVQQATSALHDASGKAKIASLTQVRDKAQAEVDLAKHRLTQMELSAPQQGVIVYLNNFTSGWMNAKPFQIGDQVCGGCTIAEIPDLTTLEMEGQVDETDRGMIQVGQEVQVNVDALPENPLKAELASISLLSEANIQEWPPTYNFRAFARIRQPDPRLRPAMRGSMDIAVRKIPDALSVPAKAVFSKDGRPTVYVARRSGFQAVPIEIIARNPDEVAIRGVSKDDKVSLVDIEKPGEEKK